MESLSRLTKVQRSLSQITGPLSVKAVSSLYVQPIFGSAHWDETTSTFWTVGFGVGVIDLVGNAAGVALEIIAPLFHTNLLPALMQVNFFPFAVCVKPALLHLAPALGAASAGAALDANIKRKRIVATNDLCFMKEGYSRGFENSRIDLVIF